MRAAYYDRNGTAAAVLHVGEVETPNAGPGEVRVRLKTSGVNPSDVKSRAGTTRKIAYPRVIPQSDGAGEIDQVGDGVPATRLGERVWTFNAQWRRAFGTAADYVVLPHELAVRLPPRVGFEEGAALGVPALTAWRAVELAEVEPGRIVLVQAGAGAVGNYAIQFAKERGATVIATVSSAEKAEIARAAGADHAIDYKTEPVGERVAAMTGSAGVHAVIEVDLTANIGILPALLRHRANLVVYGTDGPALLPASLFLVNEIAVRFMHVYQLTPAERLRGVADVTRLLEQGRLGHRIAARFPLARIVEAHEAVESGKTIGKVVVEIA